MPETLRFLDGLFADAITPPLALSSRGPVVIAAPTAAARPSARLLLRWSNIFKGIYPHDQNRPPGGLYLLKTVCISVTVLIHPQLQYTVYVLLQCTRQHQH
jgi:hypothetical protein